MLEHLPNELLEIIIGYLDNDIFALRATSTLLCDAITHDDRLWRSLYDSTWKEMVSLKFKSYMESLKGTIRYRKNQRLLQLTEISHKRRKIATLEREIDETTEKVTIDTSNTNDFILKFQWMRANVNKYPSHPL